MSDSVRARSAWAVVDDAGDRFAVVFTGAGEVSW